jgi:hypothetical protein
MLIRQRQRKDNEQLFLVIELKKQGIHLHNQ